MSLLIPFNDLFPTASEATLGHKVFGFNTESGLNEAVTIAQIKALLDNSAPAWGDITGKPSTFAPSAHTFGSHSNVNAAVDSAPDGTIIKKVGGVWAAAVPGYLSEETDPVFTAHAAANVTNAKISNWDQAHGWGPHAGNYRPITWNPAWGDITGKPSTFAPSAHGIESHSNAAGLAGASNGQLAKMIAGTWTAWTPDYLDSSYSPPPDPTISAELRAISPANISVWNNKALEFADLADGSVPLIKDGIPIDAAIMGVFSVNPYDPETEPEDHEAFIPALLRVEFPVPVKAEPAEAGNQLATLSQVPVLYEEDLEAIAAATAHGTGNPFATISDLFSVSGTPTEGYIPTIVSGVPTWAAPSGGGGSNWTSITEGIYRNGSVFIGRTTQKSLNSIFEVKSKSTSPSNVFINFETNEGDDVFQAYSNTGIIQFPKGIVRIGNPSSPTSFGLTIKSETSSSSFSFFRLENNAGTVLFDVLNGGVFNWPGSSLFRVGNPTATTSAGATFKGSNSTTSSVFRIINSSETILSDMLGNGSLWIYNGRLRVGGATWLNNGASFRGDATGTQKIFVIENNDGNEAFQVRGNRQILMPALPTSDPLVTGSLYIFNDGTRDLIAISAG